MSIGFAVLHAKDVEAVSFQRRNKSWPMCLGDMSACEILLHRYVYYECFCLGFANVWQSCDIRMRLNLQGIMCVDN
jgi:hypothetical protein